MIKVTLQLHHEPWHRQLECVFSLFWPTSNKTSKTASLAFVRGLFWLPVTHKVVPCHDGKTKHIKNAIWNISENMNMKTSCIRSNGSMNRNNWGTTQMRTISISRVLFQHIHHSKNNPGILWKVQTADPTLTRVILVNNCNRCTI